MFNGLRERKLYAFIPDEPPVSLLALQERYRDLQSAQSPNENEHWLNWIVFIRDTEIPVGYVQSTVKIDGTSQIAYLIFAEHWNKGFATEAVAAALSMVFNRYDSPVIEAFIDTRNIASQALVSKLKFSCIEEIK